MARSSRKRRRNPLAAFLATSFVLGVILGAVLTSIWIRGAPVLHFLPGENYTRSITIVYVNDTEHGGLAVIKVELRSGSGRIAIAVPPYENEDTQEAALYAKEAAETYAYIDLSQTDIIISIEDVAPGTTIAGPSASAAVAVLIVAAVNAKENTTPNQVLQGAVISAAINWNGRLEFVGKIAEKYQTVRNAVRYSLFVIAETQDLENLRIYPDLSVKRARNLEELVDIILV